MKMPVGFLLVILSGHVFSAEQPLFIGVLEDQPCSGISQRFVRPLFFKSGSTWSTFTPSNNRQVIDFHTAEWQVIHFGADLGQIEAVTSKVQFAPNWTFARDAHLPIASTSTNPVVDDVVSRFSSWCGTPAHRPLAISTQRSPQSPDRWALSGLTDTERALTFSAFTELAGNPVNCKDPYENLPAPWQFSDTDLEIVSTYLGPTNTKLVGIGFKNGRYRCDGPADKVWSSHWFLLMGTAIQFIGNQLQLVDASDYDGDGKFELLFQFSGYNEDGYTLFDETAQRIDLHWSYH